MTSPDDYCELCDLPRSQCFHGRPSASPKKTVTPPKPKKRPTTGTAPAAGAGSLATRRWTPPEVFKPLIIAVLERAGGELEADDLFRELEILAEDRLRPADTETTPEGELRWQYAARRARVRLIEDGLMTKTRPGVWQLAPGDRDPSAEK